MSVCVCVWECAGQGWAEERERATQADSTLSVEPIVGPDPEYMTWTKTNGQMLNWLCHADTPDFLKNCNIEELVPVISG